MSKEVRDGEVPRAATALDELLNMKGSSLDTAEPTVDISSRASTLSPLQLSFPRHFAVTLMV